MTATETGARPGVRADLPEAGESAGSGDVRKEAPTPKPKRKTIGNACHICEDPVPQIDGRSRCRRYCSPTCRNAMRRTRYEPKGKAPLRPLAERLWSRCERQPNGCLEWQRYRHPTSGYGQIGRGRREEGIVGTHRAAWEVTHGPIPDGLDVLHRCDNPPCCDPDHLFLGTDADNSADKVAKGRQARGAALPQTKLSDAQVTEIRRRYDRRFGPPKRGGRRSNARELAAEFGVTEAYVMQLVHGHFRKNTR